MFIETSLLKSPYLHNVYLKLENTQPSGSFKSRGMTNLVTVHVSNNKNAEFFCSSGGNAGLAAAEATQSLSEPRPCTVVVPEATSDRIMQRLSRLGANALRHGSMWAEADAHLRSLMSQSPNAIYVSPFDDPLLWEGHSTLVDEIANQLPTKPSSIVLSVGGGGLYLGVMTGLAKHKWLDDVTVYAIETEGASCFAQALKAGYSVRTDPPTSIAKSLGSTYVPEQAVQFAKKSKTVSILVTDDEAVSAVNQLADQHNFIVEPACGATFAAIYTGKVPTDKGPVVAIICGGSTWTAQNVAAISA